MSIGIGVYQGGATLTQIALPNNLWLCMLCANTADVIRRSHPKALIGLRPDQGNDSAQTDTNLSPESEALRWYEIIRHTVASVPAGTFSFTTGVNEDWPSTPEGLTWRATFEIELCRLVQNGMQLPYAWGEIPVGNLNAEDVAIFKQVFTEAWATNAHLYLDPKASTVADDTSQYYLWRPVQIWLPELRKLGVSNFRLIGGECGPYVSPPSGRLVKDINVSYSTKAQQLGFEFIGACAYGIGLVGNQTGWNLSDAELTTLSDSSVPTIPKLIPPHSKPWKGRGAFCWYKSLSTDADGVIRQVKKLALNWLAVKLADGGTFGDGKDATIFQRQFNELCPKLHAIGVKAGAFVYNYLDDPISEADRAAYAQQAGADFLLFDVEYEAINRLVQAERFFTELRARGVTLPLVFCPDFRILVGNAYAPWSQYSPNLISEPWPWQTFADNCQCVMPQLYDTDFQTSPGTTFGLVDVWDRFCQTIGVVLDLAPVLPSTASPDDLSQSLQEATKYHSVGVSLWRLDNASDAVATVFKTWTSPEEPMNEQEFNTLGEHVFFTEAGVPFNPTAALTAAWCDALKVGKWLGRPRGTEFDVGRFRLQEFEYGVTWAEKANWSNRGYDLSTVKATAS